MFGEMSLIDFFIASPTMIVLAICSIVTVGFAIERLLYFKTSSVDTRRFMTELANRMKSGNPRSALEFCTQHDSPMGRVMAQGVMHLNRSRDELAQRLDTAIDLETVEMERNISVLGTMSNIAPLLGLFGTVIGIMKAFVEIRPGTATLEAVGPGISHALIATAVGLFAAIPAVMAYNYFVRRIKVLYSEMDNFSSDFLNIVKRHFLK